VTPGSNLHAWWKCPQGPDHEWRSRVGPRKLGVGCPFCAGRRVSTTNSLAVVCPELAREWHPTKNGELTPHHVTHGSTRRVWWRCQFGHEWHATVNQRSCRGRSGCPHCRRLPRKQAVATTSRRRTSVRFAEYEGARHGPVRRVK
jgi:hypothetical protein